MSKASEESRREELCFCSEGRGGSGKGGGQGPLWLCWALKMNDKALGG